MFLSCAGLCRDMKNVGCVIERTCKSQLFFYIFNHSGLSGVWLKVEGDKGGREKEGTGEGKVKGVNGAYKEGEQE